MSNNETPWTGVTDEDRETAEAFATPAVGDSFHEMLAFRVFVVAVEPEGRIAVLEANPPCTLPGDGRLRVFASHDDFRAAYGYGSIPGYWVRLSKRGSSFTGWFPGWPEPATDDRATSATYLPITAHPDVGVARTIQITPALHADLDDDGYVIGLENHAGPIGTAELIQALRALPVDPTAGGTR